MKPKLTETVQVRLTPQELVAIETIAENENRSLSNCLRQLVKAGMTATGFEQRAAAWGHDKRIDKTRTDRAAAERRIAALEAKRARQLLESDIATVDETDAAIAAEKRAIAILVEREAALARADRKRARQDREADRAAAIKVIAPILDQRTAWATELQEALKRVVVLHDQINEHKPNPNALAVRPARLLFIWH